MRDVCANRINNQPPRDAVYKDVVIVGNGPSGISLSYMLSGHWPYWNTDKVQDHPDELLRARLNYADGQKSLVEQDLLMLADGLEGRSTNPVSLLLDSLQHPCADIGMDLPSMLEYKYHPEKQIDHIVLGKGPPGGSWHRMDPNLRTLSLSTWMSLPGLDYNEWEADNLLQQVTMDKHKQPSIPTGNEVVSNITQLTDTSCPKCIDLREKTSDNDPNYTSYEPSQYETTRHHNGTSNGRVQHCQCSNKNKTITSPAKIQAQNQNHSRENSFESDDNYSLNNGTLERRKKKPSELPRRNLSLKRTVSKDVQTRALVSRVAEYYENYVQRMELAQYFANDTNVTSVTPVTEIRPDGARWYVYGINTVTGKSFVYATKNVVLANGASDLANRLGLRGENVGISWIKHELPKLEAELEKLDDGERTKLKTVMVVGAGLSAADAVTICRSSNIHVIHVYRNLTAGLDKMLPENIYPEYHEVHKMMKDTRNQYNLYTPLPEHTIIEVATGSPNKAGHRVRVQHLKTGETKDIFVSFCAILIGSRPDLRFIANATNNKKDAVAHCNGSGSDWFIGRQWSWFKNIYAKCKHLNMCEWSRRMGEYKRVCSASPQMREELLAMSKDANGLGIGENPNKPIDCKTNPIAVNKYTNHILNVSDGLYAMGPLVGDNFVRFIPGGALAITSALNKEND